MGGTARSLGMQTVNENRGRSVVPDQSSSVATFTSCLLSKVRRINLRTNRVFVLTGYTDESVRKSIIKTCTQMVVLLSQQYEVTVLLYVLECHFEESDIRWEEMQRSKTENFLEGMCGTLKEPVYRKGPRH